MTDKRLMRTLSGVKLEMLVGRGPVGELAEAEIARREKRRTKKAKRLAKAA
ncbi:MAG: hypothetical protein IJH50_03060 [Kiritimatiellae bacterium]|nr:hypothetical protein [Kiritimatiellia bacterium]